MSNASTTGRKIAPAVLLNILDQPPTLVSVFDGAAVALGSGVSRLNTLQIDGAPNAYQIAITGSEIAQPKDEVGAKGMIGLP